MARILLSKSSFPRRATSWLLSIGWDRHNPLFVLLDSSLDCRAEVTIDILSMHQNVYSQLLASHSAKVGLCLAFYWWVNFKVNMMIVTNHRGTKPLFN